MGACPARYTEPIAVASKWFPRFEEQLPDQAGKVVVVTGCTTGTGFVFARTCAKKGARVVLLNRPSERAEKAERQIKEAAPQAAVETVECDLTSLSSVRAAALALSKRLSAEGVDVLCCNAGVMALEDVATADGYDVQMQTNHLSHFCLAKELFPLLEQAAQARGEARIVSHSSGARLGARSLKPEYLGANGGRLGARAMLLVQSCWVRYAQSKLANSVWTQALHRRLRARGSAVKALCATPGIASTHLAVTASVHGGMGRWGCVMNLAQSAEDGTMPLLQCCLGPAAASGQLLEPRYGRAWGEPAAVRLEAGETDPASHRMLWEMSEAACGEWNL